MKNEIIPSDLIASKDIEKFLIRGAIYTSPHLWGRYQNLIEPLTIEGEKPSTFGSFFGTVFSRFYKDKEEALFDQFVQALNSLKLEYKNKTLSIEVTTQHRDHAVKIAKDFCEKANEQKISKNIFPQLETVSENIASRTPVLSYAETKRQGYGSTN